MFTPNTVLPAATSVYAGNKATWEQHGGVFACLFQLFFETLSKLRKSCKNNSENRHLPLSQMHHLLAFCNICLYQRTRYHLHQSLFLKSCITAHCPPAGGAGEGSRGNRRQEWQSRACTTLNEGASLCSHRVSADRLTHVLWFPAVSPFS